MFRPTRAAGRQSKFVLLPLLVVHSFLLSWMATDDVP
jgi:hypothetical protein